MSTCTKKSMRRAYRVLAVICAFVLVLSMASLTGCSLLSMRLQSISFVDASLDLEIGDTLEVTASMLEFSPRYASDKTFYLESDDESIAAISGEREIVGMGYGSTTVTAYAYSDESVYGEVTVNVAYTSDISVRLTCEDGVTTANGIIVASTENPQTLEFTCGVSAGADPLLTPHWDVDGQPVSASGYTFRYDTPQTAGEYTVHCALYDDDTLVAEHSVAVRVYRPFTAHGTYSGEINQNESSGFSTVTFAGAPDGTYPADNPEPIYDWYCNGEYVASGTYAFCPTTAGKYEITLKINGAKAQISGENSVTVRVRGTVKVQNLQIDFDNCYPNVFLRWDEIGANVGYEVKIGSATYSSENTAHKDLFTHSSFNASGKLNIFTDVSVSVRALGDDELISASLEPTRATLSAVPTAAREYLEEEILDGAKNMYFSDTDEFNEAYAEMLVFRRNNDRVSMEGFVAFDAPLSAIELASAASKMGHLTGAYSISAKSTPASDTVRKNTTVWVQVDCKTVNQPTLKTGAGGKNDSNAALHALRPHINTDPTTARAAGATLAVDLIEQGVSVRTSEELYYVAEKGYRPIPEKNSRADSIYRTARTVLLSIIGTDMTDIDKAHAIYDYIMWKVIYDSEVVDISDTAQSVKYGAYYLEGVFDSDFSPFAVCDGMAKAYSLLCNMEGIPCVRITGYAGSGGSWGGHAWNKVYVDGRWYNVDCTWGDYTARIGNVVRELATHEYFLKTDAEISSTHREDAVNDFPDSTAIPYNWYNQKTAYDGGTIDFYISSYDGWKSELERLVDYTVATKPTSSTVTIGSVTAVSNYYGIEVRFSADVSNRVSDSQIKIAVETRLPLQYRILSSGNFIKTSGGGIILIRI